ncbi:hypothetical protein B0H34DRAFT_683559 [Crassisporium funariophilum]|nr:hypothetical protein B0H34DRAFT_683559 [Crassisporium funariophilum]
MDDRDYGIGFVATASSDWINKEKAFFKSEFQNAQKELKRQENAGREESKKAKKLKAVNKAKEPASTSSGNPSKLQLSSVNASVSSEEDEPLIKLLIPASHKKRKRELPPSSDEEDLQQSVENSRPHKVPRISTSVVEVEDSLSRHPSPTSLFSEERSSPETALAAKTPRTIPLPSAPAPKKPIPLPPIKISRRPTNPHARIADTPTSAIAAGGGISTKQRLAQGALAPTLPKEVPAQVSKAAHRPLPQKAASSSTLQQLSFKKKPSLSISIGPTSQQTLRPTAILPNNNEPSLATLNSNPPQSPHPQSSTRSNATSPIPRLSSMSAVSASMLQAELFLEQVMPSSLAGPLVPTEDVIMGQPLVKPVQHRPLLPGRIPKKWKWEGPLTLNTTGNILCNVKLHHLTESKPFGMCFSVAFENIPNLNVANLYNVAELQTILSAFRYSPQLALLGPMDDKDIEPFQVFHAYLTKTMQANLTPLILDDKTIGQILIVSQQSLRHLRILKIPEEFPQPDCLVVALLPWTLSLSQLSKECRRPDTAVTSISKPVLEPARWDHTIRTKPAYHIGLHMLGFSEDLHKLVYGKSFLCWWNSGSKKAGMETDLLHGIVVQAGAEPTLAKYEVKVFFVHVGALDTLHMLPSLAERRKKTPYVQFYTYGTHEDISPDSWSIREIYPCGGVITFSPSAMLHDPVAILQKIRQIHKHPLWTCYILPAALGMLVRMICGDTDPLSALKSETFTHRFILEAIEKGEISLLHAPPKKAIGKNADDPKLGWLKQYCQFTPITATLALEMGTAAFHSKYMNIAETQWEEAIEAEILEDMTLMQQQPAIMTQYRRYVVFNTASHTELPVSSKGLEWTSATTFDFRDEFFPKQMATM